MDEFPLGLHGPYNISFLNSKINTVQAIALIGVKYVWLLVFKNYLNVFIFYLILLVFT